MFPANFWCEGFGTSIVSVLAISSLHSASLTLHQHGEGSCGQSTKGRQEEVPAGPQGRRAPQNEEDQAGRGCTRSPSRRPLLVTIKGKEGEENQGLCKRRRGASAACWGWEEREEGEGSGEGGHV